jgi:hypothetical protein
LSLAISREELQQSLKENEFENCINNTMTNLDKITVLPIPQFNDVDNLNALSIIAKKPGGSRNGFIGITEDNTLYFVKMDLGGYDTLSMVSTPEGLSHEKSPNEKPALESFSAQLIRAIWGAEYAADIRLIPIKLPMGYQRIQVSKNHQTTLEKYNLSPIDEETFIISALNSYPVISPYQVEAKSYGSILHVDGSFKKIIELTTIGLLIGIADLKAENTICDPDNIIKLIDCEALFERVESSNKMLPMHPYTEFSSLINTQEGRGVITKFLKFDDSILENLLKQYSCYLSDSTINKIRSNFKQLKQLPELQSPFIDELSPQNGPSVTLDYFGKFNVHESGFFLSFTTHDSNELIELKKFIGNTWNGLNAETNQTHKVLFENSKRIGIVSNNVTEILGQLYSFNAKKSYRSNDDKLLYLMNKIDEEVQLYRKALNVIVNDPRSCIVNGLDKESNYDVLIAIKSRLECFLETHSEIIKNNLDDTTKKILFIYHKCIVPTLDKLKNKMKETLDKNASNNQLMLKKVLDNLQPANQNELQLLLSSEIHYLRLILKKPASVLPKDIERVVLYFINDPKKPDMQINIFEITDKNHGKQFFSQKQFTNLIGLFTRNNGILTFFNANHVDLIESAGWSNLNLYNNDIKEHYETIHAAINREVRNLIKEINQPIEILFLGCGQGHEINETLNFLQNNNIQHVIYGVDRDADNIKTASENFKPKSNSVYFLEGDANDIDKHIKTLRMRAGIKDSIPQNTITVCSGFLTEKVVTPQTAYKIFQKIASMSNHILVSGRTETLILRRDAKNCGMHITQKIFVTKNERINTLERYDFVTLDQQVNKLLCGYKQDGITLNMKGQARAIDLIKYINQNHPAFFKNRVIIQLQEAYIDSDGLKYLKKLLNKKSNLKIQCNENEDWSKTIPKDRLIVVKSYGDLLKNKNVFFNAERRPAFSENFVARIYPTKTSRYA